MNGMEFERLRRGWTLEYVANKIGVRESTVQRIEKGKRNPSYDLVCQLEDLFEMTHRQLLAKPDEA